MLGSLGILPMRLTPGTPVWVGVCAGALFVLAGAMIINGYAWTHGRVLQDLMGFCVCSLFAAIFGWIAFGPGERNFSSTVDLPFWRSTGRGNEWLGRAMFGFGALMAVGLGLFASVSAFRKGP